MESDEQQLLNTCCMCSESKKAMVAGKFIRFRFQRQTRGAGIRAGSTVISTTLADVHPLSLACCRECLHAAMAKKQRGSIFGVLLFLIVPMGIGAYCAAAALSPSITLPRGGNLFGMLFFFFLLLGGAVWFYFNAVKAVSEYRAILKGDLPISDALQQALLNYVFIDYVQGGGLVGGADLDYLTDLFGSGTRVLTASGYKQYCKNLGASYS